MQRILDSRQDLYDKEVVIIVLLMRLVVGATAEVLHLAGWPRSWSNFLGSVLDRDRVGRGICGICGHGAHRSG